MVLMRILLAMPRYTHQVCLEAATAFYYSLRDDSKHSAKTTSPSGSLLTRSFNDAWAKALDMYEAGEIEAFAMQHADIASPIGWLSTMLDELESSGADIISAVVPIKDERGLTSTAVDDTGDLWRPRRLTMTQTSKLPATFGDEEVGGPILLNTGLWVCRLGPWALQEDANGYAKIRFHIHDAIRRRPTGERGAAVIPEDWDFSRQLRAEGLVLKATTVVKPTHYGESAYPATSVWGWETDLQNAPSK